MTREQPPRLRSTAEWSRELGCSVETILRAIRRKQLLAQREPFKRGHTYLIAADDIVRWRDRKRFS